MRLVPPATAALLLALAVVPSAHGTHFCGDEGAMVALVEIPPVFPEYYLAWDEFAGAEYAFSMWFYEESNGEAGLQRGGVCETGESDVCQTSENPDLCWW